MSASEKLRALEQTPVLEKYETNLWPLLLPIADVVEAAEAFWSQTPISGMAATEELDRALTALDEALS